MSILIRFLLVVLAIFLAAYVVPGIEVAGFYTAVIVAFVLGVINLTLRPILLLLTLPINLLTLGLFTFVINALLFWFVASFVEGIEVAGFVPAFAGALIVSVVYAVGDLMFRRT
jgi:putative membrane protein